MRVFLNCVLLLCIATALTSCSSDTPKTWTVIGHLIKMDPGSDEHSSEEPTSLPSSAATEDSTDVDLSTASISITHQVTNEEGEAITVELASGKFEDASVELQGTIEQLTEVIIAVELDSEKVMTTTALIGPGSNVSFALIDSLDSDLDRLMLYEVSNKAKNAEKKFVISGDLQDIVSDGQLAIIDFTAEIWDEEGEYDIKEFGEVLIRDGRFHIEADIDEPTVVDFYVEFIGDQFTHFGGVAVVEPKSTFEVTSLRSSTDLMTSSDSRLHTTLVESWLQNEEYQDKMDRSESSRKEFFAEMQALQLAETQDGDVEVVDEESPEDDVPVEDSGGSKSSERTEGASATTGCEHVDLTNVRPSASESFKTPEFRVLEDEAWQIRIDTLEEIALSTEDPWISLLAVELGAFEYHFGNLEHAFTMYDELESNLDVDIYTRRLKPRLDLLNSYIRAERITEIDKKLVPGQKVPLFKLPDLQNDEIELLDVLKSRDLVYIDFWASWCRPCIATFPELRRLYASYKENGFEIVLISIDDTFEEWEEASREHYLPWLNVADIGGFEEETPVAYGVRFIPKAYLVDTAGCIVQKDLAPAVLEEVLVQQYGESSQSIESN
ncbi:MAG: TlpA disulfide reductase family protein [Gammaproteobacteria bacterium]|nr:TlpA disulfide reductase family protein [Gammaproteobacteria bacterium]